MTSWPPPRLAARSNEANRPDQNNPIKANEYLDDPDVLASKIAALAAHIHRSRRLVAYTGAGLSKAAGIPDYATRAADSVVRAPRIASSLDAEPTLAHRILAALPLHRWVQQNHDGLPQKAGFPQEHVNEIHGAWFDPSNPVVPFGGNLRSDLFADLLTVEQEADLCLCLGTSLSGMNADRTARTPALKSRNGQALGTVIINLQATPLDDAAALRVWATCDDAFRLLAKELGVAPAPPPPVLDIGAVKGLDLRIGARVRIAIPESINAGAAGEVVAHGRHGGHIAIRLREDGKDVQRLLGGWWIDAAARGVRLPLVNAGD